MASVFSEDNEVLKGLWKEHNPEEEEYLEKEKVIQWIKTALKTTNAMEDVDSLTDIDSLIREYLSEVHQVNEENTQNLSLSFAEAVDFLRWLTNTNKDEEPAQHVEKQAENSPNQREKEVQNEETNQIENQLQLHQESPEPQAFHQQSKIPNEEREEEQKEQADHHEHTKENQHNFKKVKTQLNIHHPQNSNPDKQQQDINENLTSNPNELNLQHLSKKYKDYLKVIFQHYCKASYATGQDPTFEQIMHKTTIMTINKFMMFCKDFEIAKTNQIINRNFLIEIFKKNSQCYKQMSFEQFCDVLRKIAYIGTQEKPKEQSENSPQSEEKALLSNQMVKLLEFCQLSTPKKFRQKMRKLNIQYRIGPKTNAELKVVPDGYKFKFTPTNGKSEQQMKQQLNERRIHRSERRIFLRQKVNINQNDLSLNKKNIQTKKKQLNISKEPKPPQTQSTHLINKILNPLAPPVKKTPLLPPPPPPKPNNTPVQNHSGNSTSINNANVFKKQMGYAQIHKIKQNEGYSRKRAITNSNTRSNDGKGNFKLNSIVEEARLQVMQGPAQNQIHSQHLTESLATNSREQTHRMKGYDMSRINNKMQEINDKIKRDRAIQQELNGLLDMENDQQDEYLMEHLEREKKNDIIGKRLSNRLNQLEMKR